MARRSYVGRSSADRSSTQEKHGLFGGCLLYGFFLAFALAGLATLFFLAILPVWQMIDARSWKSTYCVVLSSQVESHSSSDGTTYSIEITYAYQVDGHEFEGDRYNFGPDSSSSGRSGKEKVVAQYPEGAEITCLYDPDDPTRSVLNPDPGWFLLWALFPIPFLAVGLGGLIYLVRQPKEARKAERMGHRMPGRHFQRPENPASISAALVNSLVDGSSSGVRVSSPGQPIAEPMASASASAFTAAPPGPGGPIGLEPPMKTRLTGLADAGAYQPDPSGRLVLEPLSSNKVKAIGMGVFALITNVILGIFVLPDILGGELDFFSIAFASPFLIGGLATIAGTLYFALATANPIPKLVLDRPHPALGETCKLAWTFEGRVDRIAILTLTLRGKERATYRRGTNTVTERHTFHEEELVRIDRFIDNRGSTEFTIPMDTLPTFFAENNEIEWELEIHGDIPNWPDVKEKMTIPIFPPGLDPATLEMESKRGER